MNTYKKFEMGDHMEYLAENLIYGIECSMDKFTKTEEELANYILQRPEEVSQLTISQIAKKASYFTCNHYAFLPEISLFWVQ
ncbi:hypothetical protein [Peribacillus sp. V2I11]|uniref:hypothetical protein n=1 Tax=Peribacillus sp. V2I11 TaxID=3042277 RepID=UPI002787F7BC|nr:hypothetical protein [Peribacillus sp. V2I11]MDQ0882241.1 Uri superfamily endonuclease [Peribacillus sp. V2I11]